MGVRKVASRNISYPKSGNEDEFWARCEKAALLRSVGTTYEQIGKTLKPSVTPAQALKYVRTYFDTALRFFSAPELREEIRLGYQQVVQMAMTEYARLEKTNKTNTIYKMACLDRVLRSFEAQARLFGFMSSDVSVGVNVYNAPDGREVVVPPSREARERLRALFREQRGIMEVQEAKTAPMGTDGAQEGSGEEGQAPSVTEPPPPVRKPGPEGESGEGE